MVTSQYSHDTAVGLYRSSYLQISSAPITLWTVATYIFASTPTFDLYLWYWLSIPTHHGTTAKKSRSAASWFERQSGSKRSKKAETTDREYIRSHCPLMPCLRNSHRPTRLDKTVLSRRPGLEVWIRHYALGSNLVRTQQLLWWPTSPTFGSGSSKL